MKILHLVAREAWETVDGACAPASLTTEGFVHCATRTQLDGVAAVEPYRVRPRTRPA